MGLIISGGSSATPYASEVPASDLVVPGVAISNVAVGVAVGANLIVYMPCWLQSAKTLTSLNVDVTTNVASSNIRIGLYKANSAFQPTTRIIDSGNISSATTGKKSWTGSQALTAGTYLAAIQSDSAVQVRGFQTASIPNQPITGTGFGSGANILRGQWRKSLTFAAFTDPGTAWDTTSDISASPLYPLIAFGF